MPFKLVPPRKSKSPNWTIRGTHIGVYVDRSAKTPRRAVAARQLRELEGKIERGEFPEKRLEPNAPTFLSAALAYMQAGRSRRGLAALIKHFGEMLLSEINQQAIDAAAIAIKPNVTPATRNTYVYTPISAVMHHALGDQAPKIRRPKGAKGRVVTDFLSPADASAIIAAAEAIDLEFALLLRFLLYSGARLGEALSLHWSEISLEERLARIRETKNDDPRTIRLRSDLCAELAARQPSEPSERVFKFRQGGHLKYLLVRAKLAALGLSCPVRRPTGWKQPPNRLHWANFHTFRHTYATWMRKFGGLDEIGLVATGNWRDPRSARRYAHAVPREEWSKVDSLPSVSRGKSVESR